jgi:hypothetical protein
MWNLTERNVQMVESKVYLQRVTEPKIGGKIYFQFIETTRTLEPCIVESGEYLDSNLGRLSNFWYWMNLRTGKREHGYGCFYEMVEILENEKQEEPQTVATTDTPTTNCENCAKKSSCKLQNKVNFSESMPKMIVCDEFTPTETDFKYFTADQVRNMSGKEVKENYSDIMKSMKKWG